MAESGLHKKLLCLAGLSFFCAMLRPPFFGTLITGVPEAHELRVLYDFLIVVCGIVVFAAYARKKDASSTATNRFARLGLLAFLGAATIDMSRTFLGNDFSFTVFGVVLTALGLSSLAVGWIAHVARFDRTLVLPLFTAAFVLSHLFGVFDLLSRDVEAFAVLLYPACSTALLLSSIRFESERTDAMAPVVKGSSQRYFQQLQWLAMILVLVEILCGALLRASYSNGGVGYSPNGITPMTYVGSAVIGAVAYLIVRRRKYASENALLVGGVCLLPMLFAAVGIATFPSTNFAPLVTGAFSMLLVLMMGLATLWHQDNALPACACAGAVVAIYGVSIDITFTVLPYILGIDGAASQEQILYAAALGGMAIALGVSLCLLMMVFLQRRDFIRATQAVLVDHAEAVAVEQLSVPSFDQAPLFNLAIEEIAKQYDLTKREAEIAMHVAHGYTVKRIAEDLVVSVGTVQSHSKNIYRKLGIHRKDELIELVEAKSAELQNRS